MTEEDSQKLRRENDYLKLRCAQLQDDVTDLGSQVTRLQAALERVGPRPEARPHPLADGQ